MFDLQRLFYNDLILESTISHNNVYWRSVESCKNERNKLNRLFVINDIINFIIMLNSNVFSFLNEIKQNNNREWFQANKPFFDDANSSVKLCAQQLFEELKFRNNLDDYKVFRIYRDVRFSKDKSPYKNHFGIAFHRQKPNFRGGYYLHITPDESFLGIGFWGPSKDDLFRIRKEIEMYPDEFEAVVTEKRLIKNFGVLQGEQLKKAPKGFDPTHPAINYLRFKQLIFIQKIGDQQLMNDSFSDWMEHQFEVIRPFLNYMSEILTTDSNGEPLP